MAVKHFTKENLERLMKQHNVSLKQLAQEVGVPAANISRLKNDSSSNPTLSTLIPIAKFFDVSVSELIGELPKNIDKLQIEEQLQIRLKKHIDNFFKNAVD